MENFLEKQPNKCNTVRIMPNMYKWCIQKQWLKVGRHGSIVSSKQTINAWVSNVNMRVLWQ